MAKVIIEPVLQVGPETTASVNVLKAQFKQAEDAAKGMGDAGAEAAKKAGDEIKKESGLLATLRAEMQRLQKQREQSFDPKEVRALNKELAATQKQLTDLETAGSRPSPIQSFFGGAADFVKGGVIVSAIDSIGASLSGAVAETANLIKEFERFQITVGQTSGLTGQALQQQTARLTAAAATFGQDQNELLVATNAVAKQFGITQEEALGLVEQGFIKGANANGEFLSILREYPAQFRAAGLSAEQFIASTVVGAEQGVFSDKAADVIKEFGLRIREETGPTRDALINAFGQPFTDTLLESVRNGTITSAQALQQVSAQMSAVQPNAQQTQQLLADVFGGAGEDAGIDYILSLQNLGRGLDEVGVASSELEQQQIRQLEAQQRVAQATAELSAATDGALTSISTFGTELKAFAFEVLAGTINFLRSLIGFLIAIPATINENRVAFGLLLTGIVTLNLELIRSNALWLIQQARVKGAAIAYGGWAAAVRVVSIAQQGLNAAMRANPIGFLIGLITTLAGLFALLYDRFWQVRAATDAVWAGLKEIGAIAVEIVTGPIRGLMRAVGGLIEVFKGNFSEGFKELGLGIADTLGGNLVKAIAKVPAIGKAAGAAWNKGYADELKKGAPQAIVNEVNAGTDAINKQTKAITGGAGRASTAKAKYIKQLEYERQVITSTTDAINQQTDALRQQAAEAGRAREIETANVDPLAQEVLKIDDERSKGQQAADDARAKAIEALADQEAKAIEALKSQRLKAEEDVARMRVEGGDPREIQQRLALIAGFGDQVKNIEQQTAAERLNIEAAYRRNLQANEANTYQARRIAASRFLAEQTELLRQNSESAAEISRELIAAVYATSTDPQVRRVGIDTAMQAAMQEETLRIETATKELDSVRDELNDSSKSRTQEEVAALGERELVQLQIIESSFLRREKINRDYNARIIEEERKLADERLAGVEQGERDFMRIVNDSMSAIGRTEGLGELASSYQAALAQIVNVRRKFEETAAAEAININKASLDRQVADMEQAGIEMLQIRRAAGAELTAEEAQALNRYQVLLDERAKLDEDYTKAQGEFNEQQLMSAIDLAASAFKAISDTINAVIDLQIQELDRNIAAQERAVSDAERIAEQGNARQLALERDRLDKMQAERAKFVRQQQALAVLELIANSSVAIAKAAAQGGVAAPITIAATLLALGVGLAQARAQAQAAASGFREGGYTGDAPISSVAGVVHGREFVVNAAATERHRPLLEAINAGKAIATPPPVFGDLAPLEFAAPVSRWAAAAPQSDTARVDALERELLGLRADVQDVADAVRAMPQTRFTLDDRGLTRRIVENAERSDRRSKRR